MKKEQLHINNTGFSLVEILVAIGVFLIFVTMTVGVIVSSNKQLQNSGHTERATSLAEEAIEAVGGGATEVRFVGMARRGESVPIEESPVAHGAYHGGSDRRSIASCNCSACQRMRSGASTRMRCAWCRAEKARASRWSAVKYIR